MEVKIKLKGREPIRNVESSQTLNQSNVEPSQNQNLQNRSEMTKKASSSQTSKPELSDDKPTTTDVNGRDQEYYEVHQMPLVLQDCFIKTGYRPLHQPWQYYIRSAFHLHNETGNVWTHVIASCLLVHTFLTGYVPAMREREQAVNGVKVPFWKDSINWPFIVGYSSCIWMYVISAVAHLFHSRSERTHCLLFMSDYGGIGLFGVGASIPHLFYASSDAFYARMGRFHLVLAAIISLFSCYASGYFKVYANFKARRIVLSIGVLSIYSWGVLPMWEHSKACLSADPNLYCNQKAFELHLMQIFCLFLSGFFYVSHIPERFWPRRFDTFLHSHQLFHVAVYFNMVYGAAGAFEHLRTPHFGSRRPPSFFAVAWPPLFTIVGQFWVIYRLLTSKERALKKGV